MQFIQLNRAPAPGDNNSEAGQPGGATGTANADKSGASQQADASRGAGSSAKQAAAPTADAAKPRPTGFETSTSTGQGESSYEESIKKGEERIAPPKPQNT